MPNNFRLIYNKEINKDTAYLDADININGTVLKNVSLSYQTKNSSYSFAFLAERNKFSQSCGPLVNEITERVIIK